MLFDWDKSDCKKWYPGSDKETKDLRKACEKGEIEFYPYPFELPPDICNPLRLEATVTSACWIDGMCSRDEITIVQGPPEVIEYTVGELALPI